MKSTVLILAHLILGLNLCLGRKLSKIQKNNGSEVYEVQSVNDSPNTIRFVNPKSSKPVLREIIYYHIIERPYKDEDFGNEDDWVNSKSKIFTNSHAGMKFLPVSAIDSLDDPTNQTLQAQDAKENNQFTNEFDEITPTEDTVSSSTVDPSPQDLSGQDQTLVDEIGDEIPPPLTESPNSNENQTETIIQTTTEVSNVEDIKNTTDAPKNDTFQNLREIRNTLFTESKKKYKRTSDSESLLTRKKRFADFENFPEPPTLELIEAPDDIRRKIFFGNKPPSIHDVLPDKNTHVVMVPKMAIQPKTYGMTLKDGHGYIWNNWLNIPEKKESEHLSSNEIKPNKEEVDNLHDSSVLLKKEPNPSKLRETDNYRTPTKPTTSTSTTTSSTTIPGTKYEEENVEDDDFEDINTSIDPTIIQEMPTALTTKPDKDEAKQVHGNRTPVKKNLNPTQLEELNDTRKSTSKPTNSNPKVPDVDDIYINRKTRKPATNTAHIITTVPSTTIHISKDKDSVEQKDFEYDDFEKTTTTEDPNFIETTIELTTVKPNDFEDEEDSDKPFNLEEMLKSDEFWKWLSGWTETYMKLVTKKIKNLITEEVSKQIIKQKVNPESNHKKNIEMKNGKPVDININIRLQDFPQKKEENTLKSDLVHNNITNMYIFFPDYKNKSKNKTECYKDEFSKNDSQGNFSIDVRHTFDKPDNRSFINITKSEKESKVDPREKNPVQHSETTLIKYQNDFENKSEISDQESSKGKNNTVLKIKEKESSPNKPNFDIIQNLETNSTEAIEDLKKNKSGSEININETNKFNITSHTKETDKNQEILKDSLEMKTDNINNTDKEIENNAKITDKKNNKDNFDIILIIKQSDNHRPGTNDSETKSAKTMHKQKDIVNDDEIIKNHNINKDNIKIKENEVNKETKTHYETKPDEINQNQTDTESKADTNDHKNHNNINIILILKGNESDNLNPEYKSNNDKIIVKQSEIVAKETEKQRDETITTEKSSSHEIETTKEAQKEKGEIEIKENGSKSSDGETSNKPVSSEMKTNKTELKNNLNNDEKYQRDKLFDEIKQSSRNMSEDVDNKSDKGNNDAKIVESKVDEGDKKTEIQSVENFTLENSTQIDKNKEGKQEKVEKISDITENINKSFDGEAHKLETGSSENKMNKIELNNDSDNDKNSKQGKDVETKHLSDNKPDDADKYLVKNTEENSKAGNESESSNTKKDDSVEIVANKTISNNVSDVKIDGKEN